MDVGDQLPWLQNAIDDSGRPVNWRDTRRNRVVFLAHAGECATCTSYARDLLELRARLATWDGDVWLVGTAAGAADLAVEDVVRITGDADHRLRTRCELTSTDAWVAVADRWGQIWQATMADDRHTLLDPAEVIETTRFIAIQCPECETLDQPAADWSTVR